MDSIQTVSIKEKITLNGKIVSQEQFEEKRKELELAKGMKLVEVSPNNYKIRILE